MNLYNIWVSLSEMSDKKILAFFRIFFFFMYLYYARPEYLESRDDI